MALHWTPPWRTEIRRARAAAQEAALAKQEAHHRAGVARDLGHRLLHAREANGFTDDARTLGFGVPHRKGKP